MLHYVSCSVVLLYLFVITIKLIMIIIKFGFRLQKASQVPEMADLIKYVKAAFKWYTLGTHLGVENHKLKVIQENNRNDSEAALLAVFQAWLDNTPDPSWSIVVKALYDTQLGVLASEISDRFCV